MHRIVAWSVTVSQWIAAVVLGVLPFAVAMDFGGVLRWTQYVAGIAILVAAAISMIGINRGDHAATWKQFALVIPLLLWIGYSWLQTWPLSASMVGTLSSGSHAAYTQWTSDWVPVASQFPISISPHDSKHAAAALTLLLPLCIAAAVVFQTRRRLILMMSLFAAGGALIAAFGIARITFPEASIFSFTANEIGAPFATFINRNNAALMLNLGLAASLGLLSWRLMALTGQQVDDSQFEFNDLLALISERESAIGMVGTVLCSVGLLACGSRAGLAAAVIGMLLALGWVRRRRGLISVPVVGTAMIVAAVILVVPLQLDMESIKRMQLLSGNSETVLNDGRFRHWPEGWDAAVAYLPAGSGLATYGYAYLPYQSSGVSVWFEHADNLWLELFTEQGIVGILLVMAMFLIVIRSLRRMSESPDALDAGIQTMGWYAVGAILFSQWFDYGLMVPANLLLVVTLGSAIVAREASLAVTNTNELASPSRPLRFVSRGRTRFNVASMSMIGIPAVAVLAGIAVMPELRRDATIESLVYAADAQIQTNPTDQSALDSLALRLRNQLPAESSDDKPNESASPPELLNALALIEYNRARMDEVEAANPTSVEQANDVYRATGRNVRRIVHRRGAPANRESDKWLASVRNLIPKSSQRYLVAHKLYAQSLETRPLDLNARLGLVALDFVDVDPVKTETLLEQLGRLYTNHPSLLMRIGIYAADSGHDELASRLWRVAAEKDVNLMSRIFDLTAQNPNIAIADVVPPIPQAARIVAAKILRQNKQSSWELLPQLVSKLGCDQCETMQEKASCHTLSGDIAFALDQSDEALEQYVTAIDLTPSDANLRLKVIRRLRDSGRRRDALYQARLARLVLPADVRFDELIQAMADSDVRELEQGFVRPAP